MPYIITLCQSNLQETVDGGMADAPFKSIQEVPLHLYEHLLFKQRAAHSFQLFNQGYTTLALTVLGCDEQRYTANKLIVAFGNFTPRAISVSKVDGQK